MRRWRTMADRRSPRSTSSHPLQVAARWAEWSIGSGGRQSLGFDVDGEIAAQRTVGHKAHRRRRFPDLDAVEPRSHDQTPIGPEAVVPQISSLPLVPLDPPRREPEVDGLLISLELAIRHAKEEPDAAG